MREPFGVDYSGMNTEELWNHYELCCRRHDWTYDYSDDHSVWDNGKNERNYLNHLKQYLDAIDSTKSNQIFNRYSPFNVVV